MTTRKVGRTLKSEEPEMVGEGLTGEIAGRRDRGRRWLIAGAIAVVVLLVIGYVLAGAFVSGASTGKAQSALRTTISHQNTVGDSLSSDPFKGIDLTSSNPDVAGAQAALKTFEAKVTQLAAYTAADQAALQQARSGLHTSFLTLPEQSTISRDQRRVDAALNALASAQQAVGLLRTQSAFLHPLLDTMAGLVAMDKALQANDVAGALTQIAAIQPTVQRCLDAGQSKAIPPQFAPLLKGLQAVLADIKNLVMAAQAQDAAGVQRYTAAGDADARALSFDDQASTKYVEALYKPLSDAYDAEMKIAAG